MSEPISTGAAILGAAGIGALGSIFGKKSSQKTDWSQAQHGVSWRVADAKRAGIHPLAALGMPLTSGTTFKSGDGIAEAGDRISQGVLNYHRNKADIADRVINAKVAQSNIDLQNARKDLVLEQIQNSRDARAAQSTNSNQDGGVEINPTQRTTGFHTEEDAQVREDKEGELSGLIHGTKQMFKRKGQDYKEVLTGQRTGADYVMDKNTGRIYKNPNYKPKKARQSRRGRRYY